MPIRMSVAQAKRQGIPTLQGEHVDYIAVTLPYPPTANTLHTVARGRKILSKDGRAYREAVGEACAKLGHLLGKLYCQIHVFPPDRRRRDLANTEKAVVDGMVRAGVFEDDSDIDFLQLERREVVEGGRIHCILWELAEEET